MYNDKIKAAIRTLAPNLVTASTGFDVMRIHVGARMALIDCDGHIVVWSPIPYGDSVKEAMKVLTGLTRPNVTHVIAPSMGHYLAVKSFKDEFPDIKIIASSDLGPKLKLPIDHAFTPNFGNRTIQGDELRQLGFDDEKVIKQLKFVYLSNSSSKELVTYDSKSNTILQADMLSNFDTSEPLEQYSEEAGYAKDFNPYSGFSRVMKYFTPSSLIGSYIFNKVPGSNSADAMKAIYDTNFERIVMCHGNTMEKGARESFEKVFKSYLS